MQAYLLSCVRRKPPGLPDRGLTAQWLTACYCPLLSFRRKVSRCFKLFDTRGVALSQQARTRLDGAHVFAVFPQGHALVVMSAFVLPPHAVWVANEEAADLSLEIEVNELPGRLVSQVAHAPSDSAAHLVPGALQLLPAPGMFLAPALLFGELPELSASLPLEAANAAPRDDERLAPCGWPEH